MPRLGRNPFKSIEVNHEIHDVTITTVVHIPQLSGYWSDSLKILDYCIASIINTSAVPVDLMVFDNASCEEVRNYLVNLSDQGKIQYLMLCDRNVGKGRAVKALFSAAPGKYVSYTDSDVLFYPGWLEESIKVLNTFPKAGMVAGLPTRPVSDWEENCLRKNIKNLEEAPGNADIAIEKGDLIGKGHLNSHAKSIGREPQELVKDFYDVKITRDGISAIMHSTHFQYVTTKEVATLISRLNFSEGVLSKQNDRGIDNEILEQGYLRLSLTEPKVRHLGNSLSGENIAELDSLSGLHKQMQYREKASNSEAGVYRSIFRRIAKRSIGRKWLEKLQTDIFYALHDRASNREKK